MRIKLPSIRVMPDKQTPYEKEMAKTMEKFTNYEFAQAMGSKILNTPWGVLMWVPRQR